MPSDAHDAVLPELHVDPAKAPGVWRHSVSDTVERPGEHSCPRTCLGQVQAARQTVGVVREVDVDEGVLAVYLNMDPDGDPLRRPRRGVMSSGRRDARTGEVSDRRIHALLAVIEPGARVRVKRVPTDFSAQLEQPALSSACRAERREGGRPTIARARGCASRTFGRCPVRRRSPVAHARRERSAPLPRKHPAPRSCRWSAQRCHSPPGEPLRAR